MALPRQFTTPATTVTTVANGTVTEAAQAGGPGFAAAFDSLQVPNIVTAPANSASVFAPASYTMNTASVATVVQNTLGYDAEFTAFFQGSPSVATFQVGVGASSPVSMTTVATSITDATSLCTFPQYVPSGYYYSWQVSQANGASVPSAALTIVAAPV